MPKYMFRASLAAEGVAGVLTEGGTARRSAVQDAIETLGGSLEAFYFAFGDDDVVGICELPDDETAAAFAMETSASGRVSVSTTVLLSPEAIDRAREKRSGWRAPGA
ncbi:MAG: GYD domain-containing protein [Acidimicrobiia bacterium]|nr:GYD domain-containing protein [Acidimicrobiia bacterium]